MEVSAAQNTLPSCVLPRRRFVRWSLLALFLCNLVCVVVRFYAVHHPDWSVLWADLELAGWTILFVFGPLLIPVRSKRGSMLQVLGLVFALLLTLVICCAAGWDIDDPKDVHRSLYLASVIMMGLLTFVYVYVPVWLAHLFMSFMEKRRTRKN